MIPAILFYLDDMDLLDQQDENGNDVLTDSEYRKLMRSLKHYARTGEGPKGLSPAGMVAYTFIKQKIDREISKYNTKVENGRKGGKANGSKSKRNEANRSEQKQTEETETVTENVYKTVTETVCVNEADENTHKPTLDEVKAFIKGEGLEAIPEDFYNYYQASNWMRGRNPIDWKAACRFWKNRGIVPISAGKKKTLPAQDFQQRDYTEEQMKRTTDADIMRVLSKRKEAAN